MSLQLATLVEEFSILPEQDSATMRLLSLLDDPNVEGRDIARVIEADPSMTARLLTLANSAFFAVKNPVTNPWGAVMVVGFNVVRALAASGSLGLGDPAGEMPDGFFEHSIASAAGAAVVARQVGVRASDAFSAALLHDVGSPLLYRAARPRWQEAVVEDDNGHVYLSLTAERAVFGSSHDQLGAQVMEYLHFPPSIVDVVSSHNNPSALVTSRLTRIVIAGIALAEAAGHASTTQPIADPVDAFEAVDLSFPPSDEMLEDLESEIADLRAVLA